MMEMHPYCPLGDTGVACPYTICDGQVVPIHPSHGGGPKVVHGPTVESQNWSFLGTKTDMARNTYFRVFANVVF